MGNPGNRGGTGRPPNEFKERMRQLVSSADVEAYMEACLTGAHGPQAYMAAVKHCTEHGYGKATQTVEAKVTGRVLLVRDVGDLPDAGD